MMPVLNRLFELYESAGFTVSTGLNPEHNGGNPAAPFTWLLKDGKSFSNGLGIAMKEIYFLECLFESFRPKTALIIGNSFGWSTLAVGLLNPEARVVAVDACFDENSDKGLDLTNELGRRAGADIKAVQGVSPEDLPAIVRDHLSGPVDFCFVDGLHTNEQVFKDFMAVKPFAGPDALFLFHDVVSCNLGEGITRIAEECGRAVEILYGTSSGIAALPMGDDRSVRRTLDTFKGNAVAMNLVRQSHRQSRFRHLNRWKRSLSKRFGWPRM